MMLQGRNGLQFRKNQQEQNQQNPNPQVIQESIKECKKGGPDNQQQQQQQPKK